ncbi:MAG: elongation factor Ts [Endomicrobia bacterium]|nr:elongation factor Ts [Endomicrobiia bacterium]
MNISEIIQKLRNISGAGFLDCKKALEESNYDIDKALVLLRERGVVKAMSKTSSKSGSNGVISSYIHPGDRIGVLLELNCETDFVGRTEEFKNLAKELCMQIAACAPKWVSKEDVPNEVIEKEKEIYKKQLLSDEKYKNKPDNVLEKIIEGKLEKFYDDSCLLEQPYIRDTQGKQKVKDIILQAISKLQENITVRRFTRFVLGEDL